LKFSKVTYKKLNTVLMDYRTCSFSCMNKREFLLPPGEGRCTRRYKCRGRQEKVRPGTGRETGLGHAGSDQDEGIENQAVILFDPLSPTLSRRERELTGQQ
jgi:hypothetical protein